MTVIAPNRALPVIAVLALASSACLDPLVDDDVALRGLVLPAGTLVPSAHDDPEIELQIDENDGVVGVIPRLSAFSGGQRVQYWDFGPTPDFAAPLFVLIRRSAEGEVELLPHNTIIESIPGEAGYSPFWSLFFLEVTDTYNGELITSFAAIEEAQALDLIKAPELTALAVNCPAVATNVKLEVGGGNADLAPPSLFFWKGQTVRYYDLGLMPTYSGTRVKPESLYVLSREGQEPVSEPLRGVDFTGDGDASDTNNIFAVSRVDEGYTPLCRRMNVTIQSVGPALIDTSGDELISDIKTATDLFNPEPVLGTVIAFEDTNELGNCPQQVQDGAL